MEREIDINEITDGKRYGLGDLVRVGCNDCAGCSACCQGMGSSIILDPLDIYRLTTNLDVSFQELLVDQIELNVVDGVILPNLKMNTSNDACAFLNQEGRCSIHPHRPGICRIFPLGRLYENNRFDYILQTQECKKENKSKVKVMKWIDTPQIKENERYIIRWHYFLKHIQEYIKGCTKEELVRTLNMYLLKIFYMDGYRKEESFYDQFYVRIKQAEEFLSIN